MSTLTSSDVQHIFESLRKGLVPERGIETFAVGIEKQQNEILRQFELAKAKEGSIKFLRGDYGCGKTFMARLSLLLAQQQGFVTSFVVVSPNDLHFHRFDHVYKKVMMRLGTVSCPQGALGDILDRWMATIEDGLIRLGADPDGPDFDAQVRERLNSDLASLTGGKAPADFVRVIQAIFDCKQQGNLVDAGALVSWLCGSENVGASAKKIAGIKGDIGSRDALDYLRGVLEIVKAAGYGGMVVVIDEAETILRLRADVRHQSLNGIRQITDAAGSYPGLVWIFTGTPNFYDARQGVAGLAPLHDRIRFVKHGNFVSFRQAQLELKPFDEARLRAVAMRLRELYPAGDRVRLEQRVSVEFIERLIGEVTRGFKGDVGIVPRQFLRELVTQLDLVDENEDYDPAVEYGFSAAGLSDEESHKLTGVPELIAEDGDGPVSQEDVW